MSPSTMVFSIPDSETFGAGLAAELEAPEGILTLHEFPDGESYVRGKTRCDGLDVVLTANLYRPNAKFLPLIYSACALRDLGAHRVVLVTPYLPYMRQDARFQPGEVLTSQVFAGLLSDTFDGLVTVDPHLHRYATLGEIYSIDTQVQHAAIPVADWIRTQVDRPLIVGPDSESEQWVSEVGALAGAPVIVLSKTRHGDRDVAVDVPALDRWRGHTLVLVDDIISTARTMIETVGHLRGAGYDAPVCIGVHGVFADDAYSSLRAAGAAEIVTCNTVPHTSNAIDVTSLLADGVRTLIARVT